MACSISTVIKPSFQEEMTRHRRGDTQDIIETILYADQKSGEFIGNVECLRGATEKETMRNVWAFVKKNIRYTPDANGHERVKSPGALFAERRGDCKSFSIAVVAILRALGYEAKYRFVSYEPGDVTHVYVIAQGVRSYIIDSVHSRFDDEVPFFRKKDIEAKGSSSRVSGIGYQYDYSTIFFFAGAALLVYSYSFIKK